MENNIKVTSYNNKKLYFFITGLPGSGTTLMSRIMNSIDGSSSLCNPMRNMISLNLKNNGLKDIDFEDPIINFASGYKKYIKKNSENIIGGLTETFSCIPSRINRNIIKSFDESDFMIFILRNPLGNFNDWKRVSYNGDVKRLGNYNIFKTMYSQYIKFYNVMKKEKPCFLIKYEDLCENFSTEWLNKKFDGYLKFDGELGKLHPLMGVGDEEAKYSYTINGPYLGVDNLSKKDIKNISLLESDYEKVI